jgi:hypothetical protein
MTTVPLGGLFEYTRQPIFVSASLHTKCMIWSFHGDSVQNPEDDDRDGPRNVGVFMF